MKSPFLCCALWVAAMPSSRADYRDDTGFVRLQAELGAAMPTGAGVGMTQVEPELPTPNYPANSYLPQAGSGTFTGTGRYAGKIFTAKSGAGVASFHADFVGSNMYGPSAGTGTTFFSMCPGPGSVDCYKAGYWDDEFLAPLPDRLDPVPEIRAVQNHAWVYDATAGNAAFIKDLVRRQDFSIHRDNYVCCAGLNNGTASSIPDLWASAYNVISVGRSNGDHSRGTVTSDMDGPGRRKPEIVAPLDATSYSVAYVSSAARLLRQVADLSGNPRAQDSRTLKAVLLAGATKEEFPAWAKTPDHPLDTVFGAGELNIYYSYHVLNGGEQPANDAAGRPHRGWDYETLAGAADASDYRLRIPAGQYGVELSAYLVWHRTLRDSSPASDSFTLVPNALINFDLRLFLDPAGGGPEVLVDDSTSTLYNIEHVWKKDLPAGNYRLRVSRGGGSAHDYAIAWRLTTAPHLPQPVMADLGGSYRFDFPGLITGQPYKFQSSPDLWTWTDLQAFTATGPETVQTVLKPAEPRLLYRLLPVLP